MFSHFSILNAHFVSQVSAEAKEVTLSLRRKENEWKNTYPNQPRHSRWGEGERRLRRGREEGEEREDVSESERKKNV